MTAHFINEENHNNPSDVFYSESKRPSTPIINRYKNLCNPPPLTSNNKNIDKNKFNYNFETKKNGVIIPKEDKAINKIKRQNLFKVGHINNNNRNKKNNTKNKINPTSSRIEQIFGTQGSSPRNSSLISFKNNLNQKVTNKTNDCQILNKNTKKNSLKKNRNCSFIENQKIENQKNMKMHRAKSTKNKYNYIYNEPNSFRNKKANEYNKEDNKNQKGKEQNKNTNERKRSNSYNKKIIIPYLAVNKLSNVQNQIETEINNLFKILPEDFEKYPEIKNNFDIIVKKIDGIKDYIYKNTQDSFKKKKSNITKAPE